MNVLEMLDEVAIVISRWFAPICGIIMILAVATIIIVLRA